MKQILVFGSNEAGIHGAGAAKNAYKSHGARWGMGAGHYGNSYAIPTKDRHIKTLNLTTIRTYVDAFIAYATGHPELTFKVTRVGCGLAGLDDAVMAAMFEHAPCNCSFDLAWQSYLGGSKEYWGTF